MPWSITHVGHVFDEMCHETIPLCAGCISAAQSAARDGTIGLGELTKSAG